MKDIEFEMMMEAEAKANADRIYFNSRKKLILENLEKTPYDDPIWEQIENLLVGKVG